MKKLIIIFIILLNILPSYAAEWTSIGKNVFLDKSSVKYVSKNRTYKAWVKETTPKGMVLYLNEYNLRDCTWRNLDKVTMDAQNKIKKRETNSMLVMQWINVVPDTNSALEFNAIKKQTRLSPELLEQELHID